MNFLRTNFEQLNPDYALEMHKRFSSCSLKGFTASEIDSMYAFRDKGDRIIERLKLISELLKEF